MRHETTRVLQSEFRFDRTLPRPTEANDPTEVAGGREAIAMPAFTVLSSKINMRNLESEITKHQARARAQKPKWGCGPIYQKDFGKIRFGVVSIFYIPIAIGFSW